MSAARTDEIRYYGKEESYSSFKETALNKQQLASKIWESANKMRSKIEANEYKDYILGFIFYKFLSEQEELFLLDQGVTQDDMPSITEEDVETRAFVQRTLGYFISYDNLFSTWLAKGKDFSVDDVRVALSAFNRLMSPTHKNVFDGVFNTLETGLSKLGDTSGSQTKAIGGLIQLIRDIPMDGKQGYDVLGFIYEYLIEKFAANAGKKAGEFYTPHEVSLLMSEIVADHLKQQEEIRIYDPTSGSGSLLINIGSAVAKHLGDNGKIKYYAQELKANTYNLTRMNLVMRGISPYNIVARNGDTLEDDWPYFDETDPAGTYEPLYVDAVVSNPPYSQAWDPSGKENDKRFAYGVAPKSKADYAFLLHDLYHLRSGGIMTIVLPHGVLFRGGEEGEIRRNLIEHDHIHAIIGLPANIFFGTGIPTIVMVLRQKRTENDVLIVDASKGFAKEGKNNVLRACDIKRIVDTVVARKSVDKFSRLVSKDEIRANDYNLNIPRYVDSSDPAESWDIYASMFGGIPVTEVNALTHYWEAFPGLREALFTQDSAHCFALRVDDVKSAIETCSSVQMFCDEYQRAFSSFAPWIEQRLVDDPCSVAIAGEEARLADELFARVEGFALLDNYAAYQILDDHWKAIATDLEILQTEGMEAAKKIDPRMVLKKKSGLDVEVQEGWMGHVIPFDLVQERLLSAESEALAASERRLADISGTYEELLDGLNEDEHDASYVNDAGDAFVPKEAASALAVALEDAGVNVKNAKARITEGLKQPEDSLAYKLASYLSMVDEEKELKKQIKTERVALEQLTCKTIESLSDEGVHELLVAKWIEPLVAELESMPACVVSELTHAVEALAEKYELTYASISNQISEVEQELCAMIDELEGNEFDMAGLAELKKLLGGE